MTHFSDGVRTGNAGFVPDTRILSQQPGGANSPIYVYDVVPLTLQNNNIAAAATVSGGAWTLSAGTGATTTTINGVNYVALDCARTVTASGANSVTAVDITVTGLDEYLQPMTQTFSGPSNSALTATTKTFRYVRSVATAGNTTAAVSIGTGDALGFPYRVDAFSYVKMCWNNIGITSVTGFSAASTSAATAYTADVRGAYTVQSASDGTKRFTAFIFLKNPDTNNGLYGVTQA